MAWSERARAAIDATGPITCAGCGCEVTFAAGWPIEFRGTRVTGYTCECGTTVRDGLFVGASALVRS